MIAPTYSSASLRYCICLRESRNCSFRSEPKYTLDGTIFCIKLFRGDHGYSTAALHSQLMRRRPSALP